MIDAADVVIVTFPGAVQMKTRPAVVMSSAAYHAHRPDLIVGLLTTRVAKATTPTDCVLQDWAAAGLHRPSAFRSYLLTIDSRLSVHIGRLSDRDWQAVQARLRIALEL